MTIATPGTAPSDVSIKPAPRNLDSEWNLLMSQARDMLGNEPALATFLSSTILERAGFSNALARLLAHELADEALGAPALLALITECHHAEPTIVTAALDDLTAVMERDPAARREIEPFLFFKGYHALQAFRVSHWCWQHNRHAMALYLQSRIARCFSVDIHPAASMGRGIMLDHAHGIVIGETALVEDNVSFLHSVTLGGTGKETGDRHPKIRSGVMIGAGAKVLGNIEVGTCSRVAAGSVVLENVPPNVTVAGVPARIIGPSPCANPALNMDQIVKGG